MKQVFSTDKRGQTAPEYPIAFGVFFFALLLSLSSLSPVLFPYITTSDQLASADRVADTIVQETYTNDTAYTFSEPCVETAALSFRGQSVELHPECNYNAEQLEQIQNGNLTVNEYFGIGQRQVKIQLKEINGPIVQIPNTTIDHQYGNDVPDKAEISSTARIVSVDGELYELEVTTW